MCIHDRSEVSEDSLREALRVCSSGLVMFERALCPIHVVKDAPSGFGNIGWARGSMYVEGIGRVSVSIPIIIPEKKERAA